MILRNNSPANFPPSSQAPSASASRGAADSRRKNCARIFILPLSIFARTPTGQLQSPLNPRRNSRSACKQSNVSRSFTTSIRYDPSRSNHSRSDASRLPQRRRSLQNMSRILWIQFLGDSIAPRKLRSIPRSAKIHCARRNCRRSCQLPLQSFPR